MKRSTYGIVLRCYLLLVLSVAWQCEETSALLSAESGTASSKQDRSKYKVARGGYRLKKRQRGLQQEATTSTEVVVEETNSSQDGDATTSPGRVMIDAFQVLLTRSSFAFNQIAVDELQMRMEATILSYIKQEKMLSSPDFPPGTEVLSILLGTTDNTYDSDARTTTLSVAAGLATFGHRYVSPRNGGGAGETDPGPVELPDAVHVNQWVKEAIELRFAEDLRDTIFYFIREASYIGGDGNDVDNVVEQPRGDEANTNGGGGTTEVRMFPIVGAGVGGLLVIFLVAAFALKQNSRHGHPEHGTSPANQSRLVAFGQSLGIGKVRSLGSQSFDNASSSAASPRQQQPTASALSPNARGKTILHGTYENVNFSDASNSSSYALPIRLTSLAAMHADGGLSSGREYDSAGRVLSEEEWTVNTESGDSTILKAPVTVLIDEVPMVTQTESFEHQRQVNLRKDMLTSAWSGRASAGRTIQADSVLKPSHFTASQEYHIRRREEAGQNNQNINTNPGEQLHMAESEPPAVAASATPNATANFAQKRSAAGGVGRGSRLRPLDLLQDEEVATNSYGVVFEQAHEEQQAMRMPSPSRHQVRTPGLHQLV